MSGKKIILLLSSVLLSYFLTYGQESVTRPQGQQEVSEKALVEQSMKMIKQFSDNYRFGPGDVLAIRVKAQPDYSMESVKISPMGTIFHPLLGDMLIAGTTLEQLKAQLIRDISEFVVDPVVSLELVEAHSAKIAVIGEVKAPKIILMNGPITVIDAINEAGGFTTMGSRTGVRVSRLNMDGSRTEFKINVKKIYKGETKLEANLPLLAGDTVIVHGNTMQKLGVITSIAGFASLYSLISIGAK